MKLDSKLTAMLASYGRSFLAAAVALWTTGNTDPKALLAAGLAAVLPVAIRALNPKRPSIRYRNRGFAICYEIPC